MSRPTSGSDLFVREAGPRGWLDATGLLLVGGLVAGTVLRLIGLNAQSYWGDEVYSWDKAVAPVPQMLRDLAVDATHPPLHNLFLHGWFDAFGNSALSGRLLVALLGIATLPALYWLGRELYDRRTAAIAVTLLAVSQLGIAYSQEVRPYSQLMLFTILTTAFYVRGVERRSLVSWVAASVCAVVVLLTHYYAAFSIAGLAIWHVMKARDRVPVSWIVLTFVIGVAGCLPWLLAVIDTTFNSYYLSVPVYRGGFTWRATFETLVAFGNGSLESVITPALSPWAITVAGALFWGPLLIFIRRNPLVEGIAAFGVVMVMTVVTGFWKWSVPLVFLVAAGPATELIGRPSLRRLANITLALVVLAGSVWAELRWAPYYASFLFGPLLAGAVLRAFTPQASTPTHDSNSTWLLVSVTFVPLAAILIVEGSQEIPHEVRYLLAALAPFYLLTARALSSITPTLGYGWVTAMIAFSSLGIRTHLETPYKENWRDAEEVVHRLYQPGDCAAFTPFGPLTWELYGYDDVRLRTLDTKGLADGGAGCRNLWLVAYSRASNARDMSDADRAKVAAKRPLLATYEFHWIRVEQFGELNQPRGSAP
jgi:uncharacterized membrane protein